MKLKKTSLFLALGASLFLTACSGDGPINSKLSEKDAKTEVEAYYKKIDPKIAELKKDISNTSLQENEELPDIDATYPYTVKGSGEINAEIFVSSEKAGSGKDGILNEIAESFNNQHQTIDGKQSAYRFALSLQEHQSIISQVKIMYQMAILHQINNGIIF